MHLIVRLELVSQSGATGGPPISPRPLAAHAADGGHLMPAGLPQSAGRVAARMHKTRRRRAANRVN